MVVCVLVAGCVMGWWVEHDQWERREWEDVDLGDEDSGDFILV